jgi:c-di-GMP-binding flagellar brake protein YcgR
LNFYADISANFYLGRLYFKEDKMSQAEYLDRRKHARIPMVSVIQIRLGANGDPMPSMLVDLSAGGARIMSQFLITVGDELYLRIPLSEDNFIEIVGDVVWTKEMELMKEYNFGIEYMGGIQFREISDDIRHFIKKHLGKTS